MTSEQHQFTAQGRTFPVILVRKKVKNINLHVRSDGIHLAFLVFRIIGTDPRLCYIVLRSCIYQPHSLISDIYRRIYISVMMVSTLRTIPLS